ncbi:DNA-binding winged helix-turn-helix (wHTH) domain-containing protein [Bryocella elongata]|uniref:DNA-binding winged helix-turn-helix (WHTH) domain-containing protein n=1 Tax=Bryocella elongata TaxID=863522 RepID=A0A1H5UWS6_9BACT|nr:winged helix-turn-helix domain-containing protein [Bryocella elongata]SEF78888.1 DNA-binding winged helix-turn-helix (wHTH) domain-containing protein [Bryocella elongata]
MWDGVRRSSRYYEFGPFAFDPSQQDLRFGDEVVPLPNAVNRLLLLFVSRPGDLISRDEIASTLWDEHGTIDIESGINNAVRRLRSQLAQAGGDVVYIATVVGTGYRFAAPVTLVVPTAPPGATPKTEATATATATAEEQTETSPSSSQPSPSQPAELLISPASAQAGEGTPVSSALPAGRPLPGIFRARNVFAAAALSFLLLAALGVRWLHDAAHAPAKADAHAGEASFFRNTRPITFDEPEDNLTAQAISPSGESLAYADHAGITVRAMATGVNHLLNAPAGLRVDRIA